MLTGRQKSDFKIILALLALSITLAAPILAKQQRDSKSKSSSSARSQPAPSRAERQARSASAVTNIQQPSNIVRPNAGVSSTARSVRTPSASSIVQRRTARAGISSPSIRRNNAGLKVKMTGPTGIGGTAKSAIRQPNLSRQLPSLPTQSKVKGSNTAVTNNRSVVVNPQSSIASPPSSATSTPLRTSIGKNIGSPTITNPSASFKSRIPSIAGPSTQPRTGISKSTTTIIDSRTRPAKPLNRNRISSNKTSDIAERIGRQEMSSLRSSESKPAERTRDTKSDFRTRLDEALNRNRIGSSIMKQRPSDSIVNRQSSAESRATESQTRHRSNSRLLRALGAIGKKMPGNRVEAERTHKNINLRVVDNLRAGSAERQRKGVIEKRADVPNVGIENKSDIRPPYKARSEYRPGSRDKHRYEHIYWDSHNRLRHRIIWPRYHYPVYYSCGPRFAFRYVYPFYLRRYIFVSLGGYWPMDYCYLRYYWYGCHPYWWYGYYPVAREVTDDTYNYYTYNYYYSNGAASTEYNQTADAIIPVDHNTFADVREKLAQQANKEPAAETAADVQFDEAVKAFEAGDYETAIENFSDAGKLAPGDMVLPFAYSQALFANEQYAEAAEVLRAALAKVSPEKEGVFYPRGLYSEDDILFEQIEHLKQKTESYSFDADLQLLLGYQLLGIGEVDKAVEPLQQASLDLGNAEAATVLLNLVEKIKTNTETENTVQ